jgi:hypothetical protein
MKGTGLYEKVSESEKLTLELILKECGGKLWTGFIWLKK